MKKIGLGLLGIIVVAGIYYFSAGAEQISTKIKTQINQELTSLQKEGFSVQDREIKEEEEHFVISFDEPLKIAQFFVRQGIQLNVNDAEILKGLKVGVDVHYLNDAYSAVSFDIYPLALPAMLTQLLQDDADKNTLAQLEKMLEKKTFLTHVSINKLGTGFKGHMKDIDEVLHSEKNVLIQMKGMKFSGDLKNGKMQSIEQNIHSLNIFLPDELDIKLTNLASTHVGTGKTPYDYRADYSLEKVTFDRESKFSLTVKDSTVHSKSTVKDGLISVVMHTTTKSIRFITKGETYVLDNFAFETKMKGLNISSFEKLQQIDVNNKQEVNALLQQMLSKGVSFEIPTFSVDNIEAESQKIGGFSITSKVSIDKLIDIKAIEHNPMSLLSYIDANLHISFSKELFSLIAQQPQAMIVLMLFQPKDINGKKSYEIDLKDGKLLVNGQPIM